MFPVGIDVSKNTLDLCMLYDGIKGRIKTRNIQNNRHRSGHLSNSVNRLMSEMFLSRTKVFVLASMPLKR